MAVATTVFTPHETDIPGLIIFDIAFPSDERGYYQENFQRAKLVEAGLPASFEIVQTALSYNKTRGVTRGFHAEPWDKYISIVKGRVFVAYVDLRKGDSFGKTVSLELDNTKSIYLPKGVANGFQTLEDDTYYIYQVNDLWSADKYERYTFANLADTAIGVVWPVPLDKAIMSDRDRNHPKLKDVTPMEF